MILCIRYFVHFVHLTDVCVCVRSNKWSAQSAPILFPYFKNKTNNLSQRSMNSHTFFFFFFFGVFLLSAQFQTVHSF